MHKAIFNWSGGKDSSLALYHTLQNKEFDIQCLLTSVNSKFNRISMHGVRNELLHLQAESIGIPVRELRLPEMPSMSDYDNMMRETLTGIQNELNVTHSIFGDIFLEDLKKYRDDRLKEVNLTGHYPIWKRDTTELIHEFIDLGFKTILTCVKSELLDESFAGRIIDKDFLKDLPKNVDPCGENGEFHSFTFDGPIYKTPIDFTIGEKIYKEYQAPKDKEDACYSADVKKKQAGFYFCDIIPK